MKELQKEEQKLKDHYFWSFCKKSGMMTSSMLMKLMKSKLYTIKH